MFLSVFDLFKIGIGPSSSHTVGPMVAAGRFLDLLRQASPIGPVALRVSLHGSLAFTGKGHATDRAICLGLLGQTPREIDPDAAEPLIQGLKREKQIRTEGLPILDFDPVTSLIFDYEKTLPGHSNGMTFSATDTHDNRTIEWVCYSIGGGFVASEDELGQQSDSPTVNVPYPFATARQMLEMGVQANRSIADMKRANELTKMSATNLENGLDEIWQAMASCMDRGFRQEGTLPGGLNVQRRAAGIHEKLNRTRGDNQRPEHSVMDWLSLYAMAVNEENAAGSRVVTAPTNGAAGVVPAVIRYYRDQCQDATHDGIRTFLLTAAAIGGIIKQNASISGAEVGCQGEVGSASAMAAAGLCAALGGTNAQVENAAEMALEHHLGMTCDPIAGLVQVPCIERNAFGAVKAVNAASLALHGDGTHFVPLDTCVETMRQTGLDMSEKYKETSQGGLAANIVEC
ncbi:MAG: L-serine ammonia-lyase [Pseudomonadota bacterium]